jgi:hypothetical protein
MCVRRIERTALVMALFLLGTDATAAGQDPTPSAPRATLTLDQIRDGVARSQRQLRSLWVEYSATGYTKDGERAPEPLIFYAVVAARGVYRFSDTAHSRNRDGWQTNLERNVIFFTGKTLDVFYPAQLWFETSRKNAQSAHALKIKGEFFLDCLGWWPPDDLTVAPRVDGRPYFLHDVLTRPSYGVLSPAVVAGGLAAVREKLEPPEFRVLPVQEQVDGAWCHVIDQPGHNRMWIDPAVGFGVRRRERYEGAPTTLSARCELSDFRETSGVWFPWKVRRTVYRASARTRAANSLERYAEGVVVKAEENQTSEEFFHFQPPAGTLIQDRDTGNTTQVPGGLSFLDGVIKRTAERTGGAAKTLSARFAVPDGWEEWAALLAVSILVIVNLWLVWRLSSWTRQGPMARMLAPTGVAPIGLVERGKSCPGL